MNTFMWEHPLTRRQIRQLGMDHGLTGPLDDVALDELLERVNQFCPRLRIVAPQSKRLACGDVGVGAMAEIEELTATVEGLLSITGEILPGPKS
jgi:phosphopantothenoylcysteine decarboxylase